MADGWDAVSIAVVVGLFGFHIVQQRCSAPASETVEGERERMEGGKMQDAGQRRLAPARRYAQRRSGSWRFPRTALAAAAAFG